MTHICSSRKTRARTPKKTAANVCFFPNWIWAAQSCFRQLVCFAAFAWVAVVCRTALADTEQPKVELGPWVANLRVGPQMNAARQRLWGSEFVGQDLRDSNFEDCDLTGVIFRQCDLSRASFRRCVLTGTVIDDCVLRDNDMADSVINGLVCGNLGRGPNWTVAQIKSTLSYQRRNLNDCYLKVGDHEASDLQALDLSDFELHRTRFAFADLSKVNLRGASVFSLAFYQCRIDLSAFQDAQVVSWRESVFRNVEFVSPPSFVSQSLVGAEMVGLKLANDLENVALNDASIINLAGGPWLNAKNLSTTSSFKSGLLSNIEFQSCDLSGVDFSRQCLVGCSFNGCNLSDSRWDQAVISAVTFSDSCRGLTAENIRSTWNFQQDRMREVSLTTELKRALTIE
ncbi:MAG: pentapeptide repeat-containing protein [Planctomycetes bacterium]|nr:pentapeptide repeat-containing protein [Planctomycetota bacterium]